MTHRRRLNLGFEDVVELSPATVAHARELATEVSVAAGRTDWVAFPWPGHEDAWSPAVRESARDLVAESMAAIGLPFTVIVDVLVEGWIAREPGLAGVDARGIRSTEFASVSALEGRVGDRIVELVGAVAERYRPMAVTITELFLDRWTFGADDLESFRRFTGAVDWPRTDGRIDEADAAIQTWRAATVTGLVARCAAAARAHGAALEVEVRAHWTGHEPDTDGQDYAALRAVADRLVVWAYFALHDRRPEDVARLASDGLVSVGLWARDGVISSAELEVAAAINADVGVVPASLMTEDHWSALQRAWG